MTLPELRQRWPHPMFWPCTTQRPLPRSHHMAWGQCCSCRQPGDGVRTKTTTDAEIRYAHIEKEALTLTWACVKLYLYIFGMTVQLEIDHKPLVSLLSHTHLDNLPTRALRFRLRLMQFSYTICHVAGKLLYALLMLCLDVPPSYPTFWMSSLSRRQPSFCNCQQVKSI